MNNLNLMVANEIESIAREIFRRTIASIQTKDPNLIWHYTSGQSLISILTSRKIWTTHATSLNDRTEVQTLADLMILEFEKQFNSPFITQKEKTLINNVKSEFGVGFGMNTEYYIASFSEEYDDLTQWRMYADSGRGYAIGFDPKRLMTAGAYHLAASKVPAMLAPVIYDSGLHQKIAEQAVLTLIDIPRSRCQNWPEEPKDLWIQAFLGTWKNIVSSIAPLLKNYTFRSEKEWRVIRSVYDEDTPNLQFRQNAARLTRHLPIDFRVPAGPELPLLPIKAIQIGPCSEYDVTERSLNMMLQTYGYPKGSIDITKSISPYRC